MSGADDGGRSHDELDDDVVDPIDASLLEELRHVVAIVDPTPDALRELARGVWAWRDVDAELAVLVADSRELAASVRGTDEEVLLRFEAGDLAITLEASPDGFGRYRVIGQFEPGSSGGIEIRQGDPATVARTTAGVAPGLSVRADELGRFDAYPVTPGLVSLRWTPDSTKQRPIHTAWILI